MVSIIYQSSTGRHIDAVLDSVTYTFITVAMSVNGFVILYFDKRVQGRFYGLFKKG